MKIIAIEGSSNSPKSKIALALCKKLNADLISLDQICRFLASQTEKADCCDLKLIKQIHKGVSSYVPALKDDINNLPIDDDKNSKEETYKILSDLQTRYAIHKKIISIDSSRCIAVVGECVFDLFPQAVCKIYLYSAKDSLASNVSIAPETLIWACPPSYEKTIEPLSRWVKHCFSERPLFTSVIIPVRNRQEHLALCLKALSQQTLSSEDYEVIVVDDGSQDASCEVAKNFGSKVISIPHSGPGAARNKGIENAKGDILVFLDADILVAQDYLNAIRDRYCWANSLLLLGARRHLPEGTTDIAKAAGSLDSREKLLRRYSFCLSHLNCPWSLAYTCNFSITKNFLQDIRFDESFVGWGLEDIDFAYELYKQGAKIVFSKDICGYHLYHDRQLSITKYQSWLQNLERFLQKHSDEKAQAFSLFKQVFNPEIRADYFDVFDKFENRLPPERHLEICDLAQVSGNPIQWIQQKLQKTSSDILLLGNSSNAILDIYLPFLNSHRIKSFISKEDWQNVEQEFRCRYLQSNRQIIASDT